MNATEDARTAEIRRKKNIVGVVAIALLILFTILDFLRIISVIEWIIADLAVALVANLILRRIGRGNR